MRKCNQPANRAEDFVNYNIGRVGTLLRDVISNVVEISEGFRVKSITAQAVLLRCASVFAFKREKASSPSMGCTRPDFISS